MCGCRTVWDQERPPQPQLPPASRIGTWSVAAETQGPQLLAPRLSARGPPGRIECARPTIAQEGRPAHSPGLLEPGHLGALPLPGPCLVQTGAGDQVWGSERFMNTGALPETPFFSGDALTQWLLSKHRTPLQGRDSPSRKGMGAPSLLHPSFPSRPQLPGQNSGGWSGLAVAAETCHPQPQCGPPHLGSGSCL